MPLVINTNTMSINAQRHLTTNTKRLSTSMERLSSGYRINRAGDDAAGLQIATNLRSQVEGSKKAMDNVLDGVNVLNIADGALGTITENLQRMRELTVQAANDTYDASSRASLKQEMDALSNEIERIATSTEFNGVMLLDGSTNGANNFILQVGANNGAVDIIDIGGTGAFADVDVATMNVNPPDLLVTNNTLARATLTNIDAALVTINNQRADIGAIVNRLEKAASNLSTAIENIASAESRIRDVDVAKESAELVRNQIMQQAAGSVLSQANTAPQIALQLIQG